MRNLTDEEIKEILKSAKNIAVVGLSGKPGRDSHRVAAYLKTRAYKLFPSTLPSRSPWVRKPIHGWKISPKR